MPTKEPIPPPPKKRLVDDPSAESALQLAVWWRKATKNGDSLEASKMIASMGKIIDMIIERVDRPPTSPPPPKPK